MQVHESSHQPQAASPVQAPQSPSASHGSVATHRLCSQRQSEHEPSPGPDDEPVMQVQDESHQPQLPCVVQVSQPYQSLHGSDVVQAAEYQTQPPHEPAVGPVYEPVWQEPVSSHHPQLAVAVQVAQSAEPAQSSVVQSLDSHFQSPHAPPVGPPNAPLMHEPVSSHHPQPASTVHAPHVALAAHGSVAETHSALYQRQSPHVPESGPVPVPVAQPPAPSAHQPQAITVVQPSHEPFAAQGSVAVPLQALPYQAQSPHVPVDGPPIAPVRQVLSLLHHPQLARPVQSPQPVESAQGSAGSVDVHASPVQVSPAQQSAVVVHTPEPDSQAHRPATHDIQPQQSLLDVHVPAASTQHSDVSGLARHDSPPQQSPPAVHAVPTGPQAVVPRTHWPDALHSSPVRQRSPLEQHG
jgi:hypothetical protein